MKISRLAILVFGLVPLLFMGLAYSGMWTWFASYFSVPKATTCGEGDDFSWMGLSVVTIAMAMALNAGVWILTGVFNTPKYTEFPKGSLYNAFECAILLGVLSISFLGLHEFGVGNIDTARSYATVIRNTVMIDFGIVVGISTATSFFTNVQPQFKLGSSRLGLVVTYQVAPMFRPIYDALGLLIQMIATALSMWFAHDFLLCFAKDSMLTVLIPVGLFLRTYGLKGGGNALIAIALTLYFVYPYMITQIGEIVTKHIENELAPLNVNGGGFNVWGTPLSTKPIICTAGNVYPSGPDEPYIRNGNASSGLMSDRIGQQYILRGPVYVGTSGGLSVSAGTSCIYNTALGRFYRSFKEGLLGLDFWSVATGVGMGGGVYTLMKTMNLDFVKAAVALPLIAIAQMAIYESIYFLFIVSMVLPIFVIFICITMAKEITKVLGTEMDLSALEKII